MYAHEHRFDLLLVAAASASLGACTARPQAVVPEYERVHRIAVRSTPPGALIVLNARDSLTTTPFTFPLRRGGSYGDANDLMFEALPADTNDCLQVRVVRWNQPTPDTVQFDMHHCPPTGVDFGAVFDTSAVTDRPVRIFSPAFAYPTALRNRGVEGRVVFEVIIDTTGRVDTASVRLRSTTDPGFVLAARQIVIGSRFWPARLYGRKVRARVEMPLNFAISRGGP